MSHHEEEEEERSIFSRHKPQDYQSCSDYLDFPSHPDLRKRRVSSGNSSIETLNEDTPAKEENKSSFSLYQFFNQYYKSSLLLENKCSVARDHLANERTYLAWIRTSLSLVSVGIGITQLFHLEHTMSRLAQEEIRIRQYGKPLGLTFMLIGILYLIVALIRYFHVQTAMIQNYFPASRSTVIFTTLCTFIALIIVFTIISLNS